MSDPVIRRVRRSIDEAKNRGGMQAGMPKVTIDAGDAERLCIVAEALATTQAENEALRAQIKETEEKGRVLMDMCRGLKARVAELESAYKNATTWEDVGDVFNKPTSAPWLLRKQAEAVEVIADKLEGMNLMRPDEFLRSNAERLRQQANEAERAGGEQ